MPFVLQRALDPGGSTIATRSGGFHVERGETLRIGRGTNAELRFPEASIGLQHARIERTDTGYRLIALDDHSTFVNGQRVEQAMLTSDDEISLGPYLLKVKLLSESPADSPLFLHIERVAAVADVRGMAAQSELPAVPHTDYVRAYRLSQGWLSKPLLTVAGLVVVAIVLLGLWLSGHSEAVQPGPVSDPHRQAVQRRLSSAASAVTAAKSGNALDPSALEASAPEASAPEANPIEASPLEASACRFCHQPWGGVSQAGCLDCHAGTDIHHPSQTQYLVANPACTACHGEHRDRVLTAVTNTDCVACHGDLRAVARERAAPEAQPSLAGSIHGIADDHPEFRVAELTDPGTLSLNHARHLVPDLRGPNGRVQLTCEDCHAPDPTTGELTAINFEQHCNQCHLLTFDPDVPDYQALHDEPRVLIGDLASFYEDRRLGLDPQRRRARQETRPDRTGPGRPSTRDTGTGGSGTGGSGTGSIGRRAVSSRATREANRAARLLFDGECRKCHQLDFSQPVAEVVPVARRSRWFTAARFRHAPHIQEAQSCQSCHLRALTSQHTADVLLPALASCTTGGCHDGAASRKAVGVVGLSDCIQCHVYHQAAQAPEVTEADGPEQIAHLRRIPP